MEANIKDIDFLLRNYIGGTTSVMSFLELFENAMCQRTLIIRRSFERQTDMLFDGFTTLLRFVIDPNNGILL